MARRPSPQTTAVLLALADDPQRWRYGYELGQAVGIKAGSLYPILMRLHERGLLDSAWETRSPGGRPPRHLYRLTGEGVRTAASLDARQARSRADARRSLVRPQALPRGVS